MSFLNGLRLKIILLMSKEPQKQGINWITSKTTKQLTHSWRAEEDAILVGKNNRCLMTILP